MNKKANLVLELFELVAQSLGAVVKQLSVGNHLFEIKQLPQPVLKVLRVLRKKSVSL
jgi:hypothetical protein